MRFLIIFVSFSALFGSFDCFSSDNCKKIKRNFLNLNYSKTVVEYLYNMFIIYKKQACFKWNSI